MPCPHTRRAPFGTATMCIDCLEVFAEEEEGPTDPRSPGSVLHRTLWSRFPAACFNIYVPSRLSPRGRWSGQPTRLSSTRAWVRPSRCVFMSTKVIKSRKWRPPKARHGFLAIYAE